MAKILQVCNTEFYLDRFLTPLVLELKNRGHHVECIFNGNGKTLESLNSAYVPCHNFEFPKRSNPLQFAQAIYKFYRFLKKNDYDVVASHNRNASLVARVAAWLAQVPINHYTAHGFYFHDDQSKISNFLSECLEGLLTKITNHTLSQSNEDTLRMVQNNWIEPHKIETIGNGINTQKFLPKNKPHKNKNSSFQICAVGRVVKGKGLTDLLYAFKKFQSEIPNSKLLFIGGNIDQDISGNYQEVKDLIRSLTLDDRVQITGLVRNVEEHLFQSDVFVHPSYREGMPRSLLEAMCTGLPSIATNIRGAREIISHGKNGFLYPPRNIEQLYIQLKEVYQMGDIRRKIGLAGQNLVLRHFDENNYTKRQCDHFDRITNMPSQKTKVA